MPTEPLIRPIRAEEAAEAKQLIYAVAHPLMEPQMTLADLIALWDGWGVFADLDDIQQSYFEKGGAFLVTLDGGQIVGTGAFQPDSERTCELRRIALLPAYQGRGLGYAMMLELLRRARASGYAKMWLWTNRLKLPRAVAFYDRLGFVEVPHADAEPEDIWMELDLTHSN